MRPRFMFAIMALLGGVVAIAAEPELFRRPTASISVDQESVVKGTTVKVSWKGTNGTASLDNEAVELSGSKDVVITEAKTFTLKVVGKRRTATDSVKVEATDAVDPTPTPTPVPEPVEGFTLSAVGFGSAFGVDDVLSSASRDHELGAFLQSQNGTWATITDEVMAVSHPKAFDEWESVRVANKAEKPCVAWHNQGKLLKIESVAGKSKADILQLAKSAVPATDNAVVIRGKVRLLGLKPAQKGVKFAGPKVSAILKPLAADKCPSVNLRSQTLYLKNQTGGTCVLNTGAGLCEAAYYVAYGKENCPELSPYFLANLTDGYNGTWAKNCFDVMQQYGNMPFGDFEPYDRLPVNWKAKASKYKCLAVYGPPDSDSLGYIRAALNRGYQVACGISCGSGFDPDANNYISYERGAGRSVNHEIRVVAWDQEKGRFGIINSWGVWGDNGFAWLDAKFFTEDTDLWVVVAMAVPDSFKFFSPVTEAPAKHVTLEVPVTLAIEAAREPPKEDAATLPKESPCANGQCPSGNCGTSQGWYLGKRLGR